MAEERIEIARAKDTFLGVEDHGIFTSVITLEYEGSSVQGFGTYDLRLPWCSEFLQRTIRVFGARSWEDIPGKMCKAIIVDGLVRGIESVAFGSGARKERFFVPDLTAKYEEQNRAFSLEFQRSEP